ncbi:MAG TPA: glycine--tRNA ligase subunit beta [Acidocella sp.]|uniref:glycine--tRNA ligase subunit beta n=1 Tax=Acidocella sp. TaxID=50710 RepID=UPI002CB32F80|nr:glycine--tRNA ligase subunit beta [Acidocella sp.]HVE23211.1 glycine--tRNA ligase subunit beta [Acidocella sp.]
MLEFFLELFSEEIPARMQAQAASQLAALVAESLAPLKPAAAQIYYGPRRLALRLHVAAEVPAAQLSERGPRASAPEQALAGFLRKHNATKDQLVQDGDFWVLNKSVPAMSARELIFSGLPAALAKLPWPKSMRWGSGGEFTWVRPLRRIVCLLDGEIVPFQLGPVTAGNETEGHRVHAPGAVAVSSAADWELKLRTHHVIADATERRKLIEAGVAAQAAARQLSVAEDGALLDEVTGLVEWPVPLVGRIDDDFMDLPPEVRELSMKINQKYFALRDAGGQPAPYFAFVANLAADDSGAAIIAGNERVLRARLSDARHFWDLDLKTKLEALLPKLEKITFHAKIGTQRERTKRISDLAGKIANQLGATAAEANDAARAGLLCKADLVTGMVGEFPELQGIMGGYYAARDAHESATIGAAIRTHYQPKGPGDDVPRGLVAVSVALADKLDTLIEFFRIGEKPTGSGDPFALRRAALGVIRIILENDLRLPLAFLEPDLRDFILERLRVKLRGEGERFDILDAVLAGGRNDDLVDIMRRVNAVRDFLATPDGANLLTAYRRAANILRIENAKDGPHDGEVSEAQFVQDEEHSLNNALHQAKADSLSKFASGDYGFAMNEFAGLRGPVDAFFDKVTVNAEMSQIRLNRLRLLAKLRDTMHQVAEFAKLEG